MPYSHSAPQVKENRYGTATNGTAHLMKQGAVIFPLSHGHQICQYGIDTNSKRWSELDYPMIALADELWLLELDGMTLSSELRKK